MLTSALFLLAASRKSAQQQRGEKMANEEYQRGRKLFESARFVVCLVILRASFSLPHAVCVARPPARRPTVCVRPQESLPFFEKASEWAPHFPEPFVAMAQVLTRLGRQDEATAKMAEADRLLQKSAPGHTSQAAPPPRVPPSHPAIILPIVDAAKLVAQAPTHDDTLASGSGVKPDPGMVANERGVRRGLVEAAELVVESSALIDGMAASSHPRDQHNARIHRAQLEDTERALRQLIASPLDIQLWWNIAIGAFNQRREYATAAIAFELVIKGATTPVALPSYYLLYHAWQHLCDWRQYDARLRMLQIRLEKSAAERAAAAERDGIGRSVQGEAHDMMEAPYIMLVSRLVDAAPHLIRTVFEFQALQ
eukprot:7384549-Prymnesium_polylepis.1